MDRYQETNADRQDSPNIRHLTIRQWYAGKALEGLCKSGVECNYTEEHIAKVCFRLADAMVKQAVSKEPHGSSN